MFGVYEDFPETYHGIGHFSYGGPAEELQRIILHLLYQLNLGNRKPRFAKSSRFNMKTILEFGVADGLSFDYIDKETWEYYLEHSSKKIFPTLDFLCVARYYVTEKGKRRPLRFDYYILRLLFYEKEIEFQVFHERGTRRLSIEDLIAILIRSFNQELKKRNLSQIKENYLYAL